MFSIEPGKDYAVITGDVIDSSSLEAGQRKQLPELIHRVSDDLRAWRGEETLTPLSIFGGDSWRVLLADPRDALRVGLYIRASLLASKLDIDTRLVIGVAGVDFMTEGGLEEADGEAFRISGRRLAEGMGRRSIVFAHHDLQTADRWDLVCYLIETLIRVNWTANRAQAVCGALRGLTSEAIGQQLWNPPITQQSVHKHLSEAGWDAIEAALKIYDDAFFTAQ